MPFLCQTCIALNITAEDFLIRDGDDSSWYKQEHELGTLSQLRKRAPRCGLCWLVLDAAGNPSHQIPEGTMFTSYWQDDGFVRGYDDPFVRSIRVRLSRWPESFPEFNKITCLSQDVDGEDNLFLGRRRSAGQLQASRLRKWLRSCRKLHRKIYNEQLTRSSLNTESKLRVIDCWQLRVVYASPDIKHIALSYVRGRAKVFRLTTANKHELHNAGGLKSVWSLLPTMIQDAIRVTSMLK